MKTGFVTHVKSALGWIKTAKSKNSTRFLSKQPADATGHFRDPQIFDYKGQFYAIVGAQNHDKQGFIKLYKAVDNDVENWVEVET